MSRLRLENLTVDDLEELLAEVQKRAFVAVAALVGVASVVGFLAEAAPGAGVVVVVALSAFVFWLQKSPVLPRLQPVASACADFGLGKDDGDRLAALVDVPWLIGDPAVRARVIARALRERKA